MTSLFNSLINSVLPGGAAQGNQGSQSMLSAVMQLPGRIGAMPIQPLNVINQAKAYLGMREETLKIGIFVDPRLDDESIDLMIKLFEPSNAKTRVLVHVLSDDMALSDHVSYNALVFALQSPDVAKSLIAQSVEQELPTLVALKEGLRRDGADALELSILDVVSMRKSDLFVSQVSSWFADNLSAHSMALASDFIFMRPALAQSVVAATAKQNAVIAAVFFLPGADLPAMTLNQVKMVLQLAFIYGEELTFKRVAEAVVVVLCAYGSRALARYATEDLSKLLKWPTRIAVAYGSTLALGKGMELWLQHAPEIPLLDNPLPDIPSMSELTQKFLPESHGAVQSDTLPLPIENTEEEVDTPEKA